MTRGARQRHLAPGLLVSVRSASEALAALTGGATVIDVKEPDRGPLGRADEEVWRAVREVVPTEVPLSVALGELGHWRDRGQDRGLSIPPAPDFSGIAYRKLGLASAGRRWVEHWRQLRDAWGPGPSWVAVAYADWEIAGAPDPEDVGALALEIPECAGVLVDTWDKSRPGPLDRTWASWIAGLQERGRFVALAGGLDARAIRRLAPLRPDLFAVRGSACKHGDRLEAIDPERVAELARIVRGLPPTGGEDPS
ncbi:(5-formylfuran-3-yl)methyl phosphate synthase [soil metagenome]